MELYNYYPCHSLITNLGRIKYTFINGKEYIVAPMTTIVPGVLNGSKGALYYPPDEIKRNVREWDNIPITVYHPDVAGRHASASEPGVMERQGIGFLAKSEYKGKLVHEGYFDIERTKIVDNRILEALENGQAIELSTGLFTENEPAIPGANYNGKRYEYIARNYKPDHLAVLPDQIGACAIRDGCGVLVNSFFVDHLESHRMNDASYVSSNDVQDTETIDNTDNSYISSIHGNGAVDIDLATDLREGSSKGSINNSTAPYINGDTSTHSILHRMFEWLVSNSGISRVDIAVNSNPEGINQYTKRGATSEAAKASSKLSGSAKGKEALGLAQRAMASSGSGNSEKAAARHTEAAAAHREAAKAGGKDSTSHLQAAELHEKAAELHKADKPGSGTTPSPTPHTAVPATKPVSAPSPSPKSASTPATVAPKGTLTPAHVVQAIKDVHKGGLADMADVREHELLKGHSKEHQDEAIAKARSEGKVSGSSYEGRHGISERQKAAVHVDKWGEKIGGLAVRNEELLDSNTENSSLEHNAMGRGNWSLSKRSERANSLTEKADQASSNIDDDSTEEDHQTAFQVHKEAADAHRMAAREAATGSSRGGEKDFAASGYHANKAAYHADKADQHGKECGIVVEPEDRMSKVVNDSTIPTPSTPSSPTAPPAYTATLPGIKSGRQKKLKPGKASAYGSGEAKTKIEDSEDRFKPVVPAPPASQKLTPPSSTEPMPSSNANPISRDSEGQFTSKNKDKRATASDSKGSNSGSKSSRFSDPEDDSPEEGDEEKVARLRGVGAYNANPEGINQYSKMGKLTAESKIRVGASKIGTSKKALAGTNKVSEGSITHETAAGLHDKAAEYHTAMGNSDIADAHKYLAGYHRSKASSTDTFNSGFASDAQRQAFWGLFGEEAKKMSKAAGGKVERGGTESHTGREGTQSHTGREGSQSRIGHEAEHKVSKEESKPASVPKPEKEPKSATPAEAKAALDKLPSPEGEKHHDHAVPPLKYDPDEPAAGVNEKLENGDYTTGHVQLSDLHTSQSFVSRAGVERFVDNPHKRSTAEGEDDPYGDKIVVIKSGDKYHIADGNHRAAAAVLRGMKTLPAYIVHHTPATNTNYPNESMRISYEDILTNQELGDSSRFVDNDERLGAFKEMVQVYNDGFASDEQRQAFWGLFAEHAKEMSKAAGGKVERGGPESHTGREGPQSHTGREGTQSHTGREGPTKAEPKVEKQESKASTKVAPPKPEKSAEEKSGIAAGASKLARKQGKRDTYKYGRAHARAASAHAEAASAHAASGNNALAEKHSKAAGEHAATAKKHGIVGNSYLFNQDNPFVGEFDMTREADITWLATNCDCWKGPGDLETLNMLSDEKLATLKDVARHSLAEKYALRRGLKVGKKHYTWNAATGRFDTKKVVKAGVEQAGGEDQEDEYNVNADDEEYDSDEEDDMDDDDDDDVAKRFRGMKDTRNNGSATGKTTMNMQQWEASMPPEARRVWNLAKSVEANTRNTLIQQLIANVYGDKERQLLYNTLKNKSMQELQVLANLVPPSIGYGTPDFIPQSYVGASVPAHNRATTNDSESDVLPLPTINFSEWAKGNSGS